MSAPAAPAEAGSPPPLRQVPTAKRILWGLGGITDCMVMNGLNGLIDQIYTIAMAVNPQWIGIARSIPRFLDLATDPLIGHLSDNTRSRWGRRKPWMLAGLILLALTAVLMWYPPVSLGPVAVGVFIVFMLFLLFTVGYALFTIPYTAMGYEMSSDSDERTHLFKYRLLGTVAVSFLTPWLNRLCLALEGDQAEKFKGLHGVHWVSWGVAGIILVSGLMPILFCKDVTHGRSEQKVPFAAAVRYTMRNRAFWPLVLGNFLMKSGMCVTGIFFYYLFVYRMADSMAAGATEWGWFVMSLCVSTLAGTPLVVWLSERAGKKQTMIGLLALQRAGLRLGVVDVSAGAGGMVSGHRPGHRPVLQHHPDDHQLDAGRRVRFGRAEHRPPARGVLRRGVCHLRQGGRRRDLVLSGLPAAGLRVQREAGPSIARNGGHLDEVAADDPAHRIPPVHRLHFGLSADQGATAGNPPSD